jgi:hypothetical protein
VRSNSSFMTGGPQTKNRPNEWASFILTCTCLLMYSLSQREEEPAVCVSLLILRTSSKLEVFVFSQMSLSPSSSSMPRPSCLDWKDAYRVNLKCFPKGWFDGSRPRFYLINSATKSMNTSTPVPPTKAT